MSSKPSNKGGSKANKGKTGGAKGGGGKQSKRRRSEDGTERGIMWKCSGIEDDLNLLVFNQYGEKIFRGVSVLKSYDTPSDDNNCSLFALQRRFMRAEIPEGEYEDYREITFDAMMPYFNQLFGPFDPNTRMNAKGETVDDVAKWVFTPKGMQEVRRKLWVIIKHFAAQPEGSTEKAFYNEMLQQAFGEKMLYAAGEDMTIRKEDSPLEAMHATGNKVELGKIQKAYAERYNPVHKYQLGVDVYGWITHLCVTLVQERDKCKNMPKVLDEAGNPRAEQTSWMKFSVVKFSVDPGAKSKGNSCLYLPQLFCPNGQDNFMSAAVSFGVMLEETGRQDGFMIGHYSTLVHEVRDQPEPRLLWNQDDCYAALKKFPSSHLDPDSWRTTFCCPRH